MIGDSLTARDRWAAAARDGDTKMATGKIRADINFINPYPRAKIRARARARNPQRVENDTRTCYPRIPENPRARPCTGVRLASGLGAWAHGRERRPAR